jgi:replication-associated recombination protein RarA
MEKLDYYLSQNKIPNLIFHGSPGSGKKTLLNQFLHKIYVDKRVLDEQVMRVNCAFGKGIKFIREDIKYFSRMNTHCTFKSVVLLNAEKLTTDAQFALRRCIEQFSHNTRFFMVTSDKYKLIKPILSRFSELYVSSPVNYHIQQLNKVYPFQTYEIAQYERFQQYMKRLDAENIAELADALYQGGHSAMDLERYVEESEMDSKEKYAWLMQSSKIRAECREESLLLYILLYLFVHRSNSQVHFFI